MSNRTLNQIIGLCFILICMVASGAVYHIKYEPQAIKDKENRRILMCAEVKNMCTGIVK